MIEWLQTLIFGPKRIGREDLEAFWLFVGIAVALAVIVTVLVLWVTGAF